MTNERPRLPFAAVDRELDLEVKKMQTIGHLRRTARDIASTLMNVNDETAEVVALQNAFERALLQYIEASRSPAAALSYVAPDQVRAIITAQSGAAMAKRTAEDRNSEPTEIPAAS